jgi:hypothetical protein
VSGRAMRLFSYRKFPMKTRALQVISGGGEGLCRMKETRIYKEMLRLHNNKVGPRTRAWSLTSML